MGAIIESSSGLASTTSLCSWGTSRAVRIPKRMCDRAGIEIGSSVSIVTGADADGPYITIRPVQEHRSYGMAPYKSAEDLFGEYSETPCAACGEFDWGEDVGAEVVE